MSDENTFSWTKLGKFLLVQVAKFVWGIANVLYRAWTFTVIWGWFFAVFTGIATLPMWVAVGISLLIPNILVNQADVYSIVANTDKVPESMQKLTTWLFTPFVTTSLLFGMWMWTLLRPFLGI